MNAWLDLACIQGDDSILPYFADWLEERDYDLHKFVREYISGEMIVKEVVGFARLGSMQSNEFIIFERAKDYYERLEAETKIALAGGLVKPHIPRMIRDARMNFRSTLCSHFGKDGVVSSKSFPKWVPLVVQQELEERLGDYGRHRPWHFAGDTAGHCKKPEIVCQHPVLEMWELGRKEPYRIPQDRTVRFESCWYQRLSNGKSAINGHQLWSAGICPQCSKVIWVTSEPELEQHPVFIRGV